VSGQLKARDALPFGKELPVPIGNVGVIEIQGGRLKLIPQRKYYVGFEAFMAVTMSIFIILYRGFYGYDYEESLFYCIRGFYG
jgi:hypothetical protein